MKKILDKYNPRPSIEENLKNLGKELAMLRYLYPALRNEDIDRSFFEKISREQVTLPPRAERWTLRPKWDLLAPSYGEAVKRNHDHLEKLFGKINYRIYFPEKKEAAELFSSLKQGVKPRAGFREIAAQQGHKKIIIVPVQTFGYAKKPAAQALKEMSPDEFGLGSFAGSIFLLTNPGRLTEDESHWFNCPGDDYPLSKDYTPFYGSLGKKLEYGVGNINAADFFCGTATAFVPNL